MKTKSTPWASSPSLPMMSSSVRARTKPAAATHQSAVLRRTIASRSRGAHRSMPQEHTASAVNSTRIDTIQALEGTLRGAFGG